MQTSHDYILKDDMLVARIGAIIGHPLSEAERKWLALNHPHGVHSSDVINLARSFERLPLVRAAVIIRKHLRRDLTRDEFDRIRAWFPDGVPRGVIEAVADKIRQPRPKLRIVKS